MDQVSDLLVRIKNAYMARKSSLTFPHSKMKEAIAKVLSKNNYVGEVTTSTNDKGFKQVSIELSYVGKTPVLTDIKRVSKPGLRVYSSKKDLPRVLSGLGIALVSTSLGVMTDKEARKKGVGGELIARVW